MRRGIVTVDEIQVVEHTTELVMLSTRYVIFIPNYSRYQEMNSVSLCQAFVNEPAHSQQRKKEISKKNKSRFCVVSNDGCKKKMEVGVRFIHENERCAFRSIPRLNFIFLLIFFIFFIFLFTTNLFTSYMYCGKILFFLHVLTLIEKLIY